MNSDQFRRWLIKAGCTIEEPRGKGGHVMVRRGDKAATLPMHGARKQLGKGLMARIKKELDVER